MKVYFLLVSWSQDVIQILFVELISVGFDDGRAIIRRVGVDPLADGSAGQARVDVAVGSKQGIAQRRSVAGNKLKLRGGSNMAKGNIKEKKRLFLINCGKKYLRPTFYILFGSALF